MFQMETRRFRGELYFELTYCVSSPDRDWISGERKLLIRARDMSARNFVNAVEEGNIFFPGETIVSEGASFEELAQRLSTAMASDEEH